MPARFRFGLRAGNAVILQAIPDTDQAICPTQWQASRLLQEYHAKTTIPNKGIGLKRGWLPQWLRRGQGGDAVAQPS